MEESLTIFNFILKGLTSEVSKIIKIKALFLTLSVVKASRKVTLVLFRAFISCMIFTACLFSFIIYNMNYNYYQVDIFNGTVLGIGILAFSFMLWNLREKRWLDILDFETKMNDLAGNTSSSFVDSFLDNMQSNSASIDEVALEKLIEEMLDKKLSKVKDIKTNTNQEDFLH